MNVLDLNDYKHDYTLDVVSRDQLERWYNFQAACLAMLVRRAGGSVVLDPRDLDSIPRQQKLEVCDNLDDSITLTLVDI